MISAPRPLSLIWLFAIRPVRPTLMTHFLLFRMKRAFPCSGTCSPWSESQSLNLSSKVTSHVLTVIRDQVSLCDQLGHSHVLTHLILAPDQEPDDWKMAEKGFSLMTHLEQNLFGAEKFEHFLKGLTLIYNCIIKR